MSENKKRNMTVPAVIASVTVIGLAAGAAVYLGNRAETGSADSSSAVTSAVTAVSETDSAVTSGTTVSVPVSETEAETTAAEAPEPMLVNKVSGVFGRVNTSKGVLNIRRVPSSSGDIVGNLEKGSIVYISDYENGWYQIENNSRNGGYVSADYIELSTYTGSWTEKYHQIAADIQEYFSSGKGGNGSPDFYLKMLDADSIPELIYSFSSSGGDETHFFQIFSAGENELYIDMRRNGSIAENGYNITTKELFVKRPFRGEYNASVLYADGNVSEKSFFHSSFSYSEHDSTDLYMIDESKVTPEEYQAQLDEHRGDTSPGKMDFRTLCAELDSVSAEYDATVQDRIIFPVEEAVSGTQLRFSDSSFSHFFGMMVSDSSEIPLYRDSSGKKCAAYELSGTIVQVTGEEKNMYRILWKSEKNEPAEVLYAEKKYINFSRRASSWQDKYDDIIRFRENANGDIRSNSYTLADMNSDGVPELICLTTLSSSDAKHLSVYSVYDGQLVSWSAPSDCTEFTFYPYSGCIGITGHDNEENISFVSFGRGEMKSEGTFARRKISSDEYEYTINGTVVSEDDYSEKRSRYIREESDEENDDDSSEEEWKEYSDLTPLRTLEILKTY